MQYGEYLRCCPSIEPIPEEEFGFYSAKAERLLSVFTFGRSDLYESEELVYAAAEMAQRMYDRRLRRGIASESNDGLSLSYDSESEESELYSVAKQWLGDSGMMSPGTDRLE